MTITQRDKRALILPGMAVAVIFTCPVRLSGEAPQASGLVRALDESPSFEGTDYTLPLARSGVGEAFSLRTRREGVLP